MRGGIVFDLYLDLSLILLTFVSMLNWKICRTCERKYIKCSTTFTLYCSYECRDKYNKALACVRNKKRREIDKTTPRGICIRIFYQYRGSAKQRGYAFELSKDDFLNSYQSDCYYCGDKLDKVGFDRIDNTIGYISSNIVPCCFECNRMKQTLTQKEFIDKCTKISRLSAL